MTFEEAKHPRAHGKFAHVASGDRAGKKLAEGGIFSVINIADMPRGTAPANSRANFDYASIDLSWPKKADYPRPGDLQHRMDFLHAQYNGALGKTGLNASKDNPATVDAIMAHWRLPPDRRAGVAGALAELRLRGGVDGDAETGYWNTRQIGLKKR